jgi:hypothetical protein
MIRLIEKDKEYIYNYIHLLKLFYYQALSENDFGHRIAIQNLLLKYGQSPLEY